MINNLSLGLDLSTQSLTATVIDLLGGDIRQFSINFDDQYPAHKTRNGVLANENPRVVHADPRMWVESIHFRIVLAV